jgi:TonB family protein
MRPIENRVLLDRIAFAGAYLLIVSSALGAIAASDHRKFVPEEYAVYTPRPEYPLLAREHGETGSGVAVIQIDPSTGKVTDAVMAESTGARLLDDAALEAFRRWKFQPGTVVKAKIPITFTMGSGVFTDVRVETAKPMEKVLAPFLGEGIVLNASIPRYPSFPPWSNKEGKGVYELEVDNNGKVAGVRILRKSGDTLFDREAISTLGKWRLRTGPRVIRLPLAFKLTPKSYRVRILSATELAHLPAAP